MKVGFEKIVGWECLYVHRKDGLFLSAYADDYKMAGRKANITPMWAKLVKEGLELDPAIPCSQNTYLGCSQKELMPELKMVTAKRELMTRLTSGKRQPSTFDGSGPRRGKYRCFLDGQSCRRKLQNRDMGPCR